MQLNWIDLGILVLLLLSLLFGLKKSLLRGLINLFLVSILLTFILLCLDNVILPPFFSIRLKESFVVGILFRFSRLIFGFFGAGYRL